MERLGGFTGVNLIVDLTTGEITKQELDWEWAAKFLGGRGLATRYLLEMMDPAVDPYDPGNVLILATGPLTGTNASCGARYMAVTKGPLTGAITCSNSGGQWGPALKFAGYDMLILKGKAAGPSYLLIDDDGVEIRDASHVWGKGVWSSDDIIAGETGLPDLRFATIGQAGENLVRFACIVNDKHRAAGRSGVGAVMGSKNLKTVAVRGTGGVAVADPRSFLAATWETKAQMRQSPIVGGMSEYGTALTVGFVNSAGGLPTRNFETGFFETADKLSGETIKDTNLIDNVACFACTIACGRVTLVHNKDVVVNTSPRNWDRAFEGPEYEAIFALGPDCGIDDPDAVIAANALCNDYGMDVISAGATVGAAIDLSKRGLIDEQLDWGDPVAMVGLIEDTAFRRGLGDRLAEGSYRLCESVGHPELAPVSKKQEYAAYDPRALPGRGLGYATSNRGACHLKNETLMEDIMDPSIESKVDVTVLTQHKIAALDASGVCIFTSFGMEIDDHLRREFNAATGLDYDVEGWHRAGERIWNAERVFNVRAGFGKEDDDVSPRMYSDPIVSGPRQGMVAHVREVIPEYYSKRGWDAQGRPTAEKLTELELADLA